MKKIYLDTNQLYYIRRIADEAGGFDYGNYEWAYKAFPNNRQLVEDIRSLCYIVALQYEWELEFSPSNASFSEICLGQSTRAQSTRYAWEVFVEGLNENAHLERRAFLRDHLVSGLATFDFIQDPTDRIILRHFAAEGSDVLLTCDSDILDHRARLKAMNLVVMRPNDWLNVFVQGARGTENAVDWLERILFGL